MPDIGDFQAVEVIEILIKVGDTIAIEQSLISLESDKATMDIPASVTGVVQEILVKVGDKISEGDFNCPLVRRTRRYRYPSPRY